MIVKAEDLVCVRRADELPMLVGEPFWETGNRQGRAMGQRPWLLDIQRQLGVRSGPVRVVPEAQMALWAHGIDHGIVVNIGQAQTIAVPVIGGEVAVRAVDSSNM